ncbi:MAG: FAD-dependent oxidoreductase [Desulfobacterales bacterium]|nr:FAD-dependent oxidoreductase [Desulfobacterales bacterium]
MGNTDHYVIIGNGPAGNKAALTLREKDPQARVTLVSDENIPFYYKPRLTGYITGDLPESALMVRNNEFYADHDIRLRLGQQVERILPLEKKIVFQHMEDVQYSQLIIASGSRARLLPSMSNYAHCLSFVTAYDEVVELRDKIRSGNDFFIFGGDLVGFKFLKMLRAMSKNVTLMVYPHAFWPFNLTDEMMDAIVSRLHDTGAQVIVQDDIDTIIHDKDHYLVTTSQGRKAEVDMVFSFNGLIPRVEFARGCGLDIDRGILVDEYMKTCLPDIYACGSCAQIYNPQLNAYTTSIGWPNAEVQGRVAALNVLGGQRRIKSAGRKYFDLEGVRIKTTWWEDFDTGNDNQI